MKETNDGHVSVSIDGSKLEDEKGSASPASNGTNPLNDSNGTKTSDNSDGTKPATANSSGALKSEKKKTLHTKQPVVQKEKKITICVTSEMAISVVNKQHIFQSNKISLWVAAGFWSKLYLLRALVSCILLLSLFSLIFAAVFRFGAYQINPFLADTTAENPGYLTSCMNFLTTVVVLPAVAILILNLILFSSLKEETIIQMLPLLRSLTQIMDFMATTNMATVPLYVSFNKYYFKDSPDNVLNAKAAGFAFILITSMKVFMGLQHVIMERLVVLSIPERRNNASPKATTTKPWSCLFIRVYYPCNTIVTLLSGIVFVLLQTTELQFGAPLQGCVADDCPRLRVPAMVYYSTSGIVLCNFLYGCAHWLEWYPNKVSSRVDNMIRLGLTLLLAQIPLPCGYICQMNRLAVPYTVWGEVFALSLASLLLVAVNFFRSWHSSSLAASSSSSTASSIPASNKLDFFLGEKGCNIRNTPAAAVELFKSLRSSSPPKESLKDQLIDTGSRKKEAPKIKAATDAIKTTSDGVELDTTDSVMRASVKKLMSTRSRIVAGKWFYICLFLRLVCLGAAAGLICPALGKLIQLEKLDFYEVFTLMFFSYYFMTIFPLVLFMASQYGPYIIHDGQLQMTKSAFLMIPAVVPIILNFNVAFIVTCAFLWMLDISYVVFWMAFRIFKSPRLVSELKSFFTFYFHVLRCCCLTKKGRERYARSAAAKPSKEQEAAVTSGKEAV